MWDSTVGEQYPNLCIATLRPLAESLSAWATMGPIDVAHKFLCLPDYWNERVAFYFKAGTRQLDCANPVCPVGENPRSHWACLAGLDPEDDAVWREVTLLDKRELVRRGGACEFSVSFTDTDTGRPEKVRVILQGVS